MQDVDEQGIIDKLGIVNTLWGMDTASRSSPEIFDSLYCAAAAKRCRP